MPRRQRKTNPRREARKARRHRTNRKRCNGPTPPLYVRVTLTDHGRRELARLDAQP
jgi:hypothetical protein